MMRHIRHLWKSGTALALLCVVSASLAASYQADAVEELRQALRTPVRDPTNRDELAFRKSTLEARIKALNIGQLRKALLLQEWRDEDRDEAIAAVDRPIRDAIEKRLIGDMRKILENGGVPAKLAAITQIAEMGTSVRATGTKIALARELGPDLAAEFKDNPPAVKEAAARALGKINPEPKVAADALGELLTNGTPGERTAAADGLAWLLRTMVDVSKGKKTQGIEVSRDEISKMSTAVVPQAVRGLNDTEVAVRKNVLEAIELAGSLLTEQVPDPPAASQFPPPGRKPSAEEEKDIKAFRETLQEERRQMEPLVNALDAAAPAVGKKLTDPVPEIRYLAAKALEDMGYARQRILRRAGVIPPEPSPEEQSRRKPAANSGIVLVSATEVAQKDPPKKDIPAARALLPGLTTVLPELAARFSDPNVRVRLAAADAIEPLGPLAAPLVPTIARGLNDPDLFMRWATARVLSRIGPVDTELTVPALAKLLCDPDLDVRLQAATTLGSFGSAAKAAVPELAKAAVNGDAEQRIGAIHALQSIGPDAAPAIPALTTALSDGDSRVRHFAADALGSFGAAARSAIPALEKALFDRDDLVRKAASDSLLSISAAK